MSGELVTDGGSVLKWCSYLGQYLQALRWVFTVRGDIYSRQVQEVLQGYTGEVQGWEDARGDPGETSLCYQIHAVGHRLLTRGQRFTRAVMIISTKSKLMNQHWMEVGGS